MAQRLYGVIMYRRVDWMVAADLSILRIIGPPQNLELRTGDIAHNAGLSAPYTSERLGVLAEHQLVTKIEEEGTHPRYTTTEKGRKVIQGKISAAELKGSDD